jgi:hypothetical protein
MIPRLTLRVLCGEMQMLMPLIYLSASKFHMCCFLKHSIIKIMNNRMFMAITATPIISYLILVAVLRYLT